MQQKCFPKGQSWIITLVPIYLLMKTMEVRSQLYYSVPSNQPVSFFPQSQNSNGQTIPRSPPWNVRLEPRSYDPYQQSREQSFHSGIPRNYERFNRNNDPNTYRHGLPLSQRVPIQLSGRNRYDMTTSESRNQESGRFISNTAFSRITETLGAINTVGHYLVDMVVDDSSEESSSGSTEQKLPNALYTISKNVLGRNVTDKIAPIVRKALPKVLPDSPLSKVTNVGSSQSSQSTEDEKNECTTPEGQIGVCDDLSNCPQLLLNLGNLRESLCFKSSFVPGVCCPRDSAESETIVTTSKPTYLVAVSKTTTQKPHHIVSLTTAKPKTTPKVGTLTPIGTASTSFSSSVTAPTFVKTTQKPTTITFLTVAPPVIESYSNIVSIDECGQREDESGRIVGGTEAKPGAWPWMAAIYLHGAKRREFWCGGSLIGPRHILTAAHCTRDSKQRPFPPRQFTVRLGDVDLLSDLEPSRPVTHKVSQVRAHEQFSRVGFYNDIAILVLEEAAQKSKYVIPLCLPGPEDVDDTFAGSKATVVGWGTTRYGGTESSKQLQAILPIWQNNECDRAYFQPITSNFICAGVHRGGTDACQGDSGGPLMMEVRGRWTQVGLVSFGNKCGEPGYPGVYTRITGYLDWIKQNMP